MKREDLQREIARLDQEINRIIGSVELPSLNIRPFPLKMWIFALLCLAWWKFGGRIPQAYDYHIKTAAWSMYMGAAAGILALLSTIAWIFRGKGYQTQSSQYTQASRQARELQERRRDLQAELRGLMKD